MHPKKGFKPVLLLWDEGPSASDLRVACIMDGRRKSLYSLKVAFCIESCNYVKQFLPLAPEWDTSLSQVTPSITSRFPPRHQIGLLGGERYWESQVKRNRTCVAEKTLSQLWLRIALESDRYRIHILYLFYYYCLPKLQPGEITTLCQEGKPEQKLNVSIY